MSMVKVICNQRKAADILTRQPKNPGQKFVATYNVPPTCGRATNYTINLLNVAAEPVEVWANKCKAPKGTEADYRCTRCGEKGHARAR